MNEEIKKILERNYFSLHKTTVIGENTVSEPNLQYIQYIASEICQLFPKTKENPDGYEIAGEVEIGKPMFYQPNVTGTSYRKVETKQKRR